MPVTDEHDRDLCFLVGFGDFDMCITGQPVRGVKLLKKEARKVVPPTSEQVEALSGAVPDRFRALVLIAAGTGLRQGETFGLTVDRVDFLRWTLIVERQLVQVVGETPGVRPPKTTAINRTGAAPQVVVEALAESARAEGCSSRPVGGAPAP